MSRQRGFPALFGVMRAICAHLWNLLRGKIPDHLNPTHLLWSLMFLKCYLTEYVMSPIVRADGKTIRKWVKFFVVKMCQLLTV